jgi:hypothetical protein
MKTRSKYKNTNLNFPKKKNANNNIKVFINKLRKFKTIYNKLIKICYSNNNLWVNIYIIEKI